LRILPSAVANCAVSAVATNSKSRRRSMMMVLVWIDVEWGEAVTYRADNTLDRRQSTRRCFDVRFIVLADCSPNCRYESAVKLSVIIPVYNEADTVIKVIERVEAVDIDKQIIVINDCSTDGTREKLEALAPADHINIIHHDKNQGKGAAIRSGQKAVTGDIVIIQDADLEYSPSEYHKLFYLFEEGKADAVFGSRYSGRDLLVDSFWHYVGNKFLTLFSNALANIHLTDMETCYKMIRADIFKAIDIECNCFGFEPEITAKLAKIHCRIYEVPISYEARRFDEGKKIGVWDGVKAMYYIVKFNLFRRG
jgi:glycosyltransferase involved in cell wall biosynthesis